MITHYEFILNITLVERCSKRDVTVLYILAHYPCVSSELIGRHNRYIAFQSNVDVLRESVFINIRF